MADIHNRAVIATARVATEQKVTATPVSHMAQRHRGEFPNAHVRGSVLWMKLYSKYCSLMACAG